MDIFFKIDWRYIAFYLITLLWIGEFVIFPSKYEGGDYSEKKSFLRILASIVASIALTLTLSYAGLSRIEGVAGTAMKYAGLLCYAAGIVFRYSGAIYLGKYFTRDVEVTSDHELVSDGPYRILRHPLYLGLFLLSVGVALFFRNVAGLLFTVAVVGSLLNKRMIQEEIMMESTIGDSYREWKAGRYRFIPYIY
jgi:protein-S-isoprenylcysteine O-methyltransferase Ste14